MEIKLMINIKIVLINKYLPLLFNILFHYTIKQLNIILLLMTKDIENTYKNYVIY